MIRSILCMFFIVFLALPIQSDTLHRIKKYKENIALFPDDVISLYMLGNCYKQLKQYNTACSYYEKAIQIKSNVSYYYYNLAICLNKLKKYEDASQQLIKAISLAKNVPDYYAELAVSYMNRGQYETALEAVSHARSIQEKSYYYYIQAQIFVKMNTPEKAIDVFLKAIETDNKNTDAYIDLGTLYEQQGNYNDALNIYQKLHNIIPENEQIHVLIEQCKTQLKDGQ